MKPEPGTLRRWPLILYLLACSLILQASPARRGLVNLTQPDGSTVQAYLSGDEHSHLTTTVDGCVLTQDADGWWCYARYDFYGNRRNTGVHAGDHDAPGEVVAASRNIPYDLIRQRRSARSRRGQSFSRQRLPQTRAGEDAGEGHELIILAQFQDLSFKYSREAIEQLLNGESPKSARAYLNDQWKGFRSFQFDITDVVTLPESYKFYGINDDDGYDLRPERLILDACKAVDDAVDFSVYDHDGNGEADRVFVFYAGPNESELAGDDYIWPHQWSLKDAGHSFQADGVSVSIYACTSELTYDNYSYSTFTTLASIGTFCHEYTHTFDISDLYDSDDSDSGGYAESMWRGIDLMETGNQNDLGRTPPNYSAVERWRFGIGEGKELKEGRYTLQPIHKDNVYYYLPTDHEDELYLIECRQASGWDSHIGGSGLLIYHIDRSERPAGESTSASREVTALERWMLNEVNARPDHQCVDIIEPDPTARQSYQNAAKTGNYDAIRSMASHAFWPFGDVNVLTCDTDPAFRFWSGAASPLGLSDIRLNDDGSVSFTVFNDLEEKAPAVKVESLAVFQDAAIIQWSAVDPAFEGNSILRWGLTDDTRLTEVEVTPYETGRYAYVLEGLKPTTDYKVQLLCRKGSVPGPVNNTASFLTNHDKNAGDWPFIHLKKVERGTDGSFAPDTPIPLRIHNAPEADGVSWYFDGKPIKPGPDGYWHVARSGELKAVIHWGGDTEVITKKLIVK